MSEQDKLTVKIIVRGECHIVNCTLAGIEITVEETGRLTFSNNISMASLMAEEAQRD